MNAASSALGQTVFEDRRVSWKPHHLLWILGAVGLPLGHWWLIAKVEPFFSLIYCFLWWPYIFVADWAVFKLRGRSMLSDRPWEFAVLWFWSIPLWLFFEVINLRLQNWYYVMVPLKFWPGMAYLVFGFGAVLPGVFETAEVIVGLVEKFSKAGKILGRPFRAHGKAVLIQMAVGLAMLVLVLIWPTTFCAMTWGFAFFFLDPLLYWLQRNEKNHLGKSLLGQMAAGDNTRFVALLVGGAICGGLWEGWNLHARTKWIYTVPFFDELKLGEMPIIGFLGFPPFVLECYAMVNLLSYFRGGRSWELSGAENARLPGMRKRWMALCCLLLPPFIVISGVGMLPTVSSFAEPIGRYFGNDRPLALRQPHELLKLAARPPNISEAMWARLRRVSAMAELKGMGLEHALALERIGITNFNELSKESPERLAAKLDGDRRPVRPEITKIWIQAAKRPLAN